MRTAKIGPDLRLRPCICRKRNRRSVKVNRQLDNDSSNEAIINDSLPPLPKQIFGKTIRHKNLELHYSLKTFKE